MKKTILTTILLTSTIIGGSSILLIENNKNTTSNNNLNISKFEEEVEYWDELNIEQLSLSIYHSGAIVNDGTNDHLYMWGLNSSGEIGNGDNSKQEPSPVEIVLGDGTGSIEQISLGGYNSAAVVNDDEGDHLYMWGDNGHGQIGNGDSLSGDVLSPTEITPEGFEGTIKQISLGYEHSGAITTDFDGNDHLYIWGSDEYGQIGNGDSSASDVLSPQEIMIEDSETIKQISLGGFLSGAIVNDGTNDHLYMWGNNEYGQIGNNSIENVLTPQEIVIGDGTDSIEQISLGAFHSGAIVNDGTNDHLYMWGSDSNGEIGNGSESSNDVISPEEIILGGGTGTIKQLSLGDCHSGAIVNDGTNDHLYMWGDNEYGQIGNGDSLLADVLSPEEITPEGFEETIKQISLGSFHSGAIVNDGTNDHLYMWGWNSFGALGNGNSGIAPDDGITDENELNNINVKSNFILEDSMVTNITPTQNSVKLTIEYSRDTNTEKLLDSSLLQAKMNENELVINEIDNSSKEALLYSNSFEIIGLQSGVMYGVSRESAIQLTTDNYGKSTISLPDFVTIPSEDVSHKPDLPITPTVPIKPQPNHLWMWLVILLLSIILILLFIWILLKLFKKDKNTYFEEIPEIK